MVGADQSAQAEREVPQSVGEGSEGVWGHAESLDRHRGRHSPPRTAGARRRAREMTVVAPLRRVAPHVDLVPGYSSGVDQSHGTTAAYRRGCGCEECRAANAADHRERIARFASEGGHGEHGSVYRYKTGCRCEDCKRANTEQHRILMARYRADGGRGEHGTQYRYTTGCRCRACTAANSRRRDRSASRTAPTLSAAARLSIRGGC